MKEMQFTCSDFTLSYIIIIIIQHQMKDTRSNHHRAKRLLKNDKSKTKYINNRLHSAMLRRLLLDCV